MKVWIGALVGLGLVVSAEAAPRYTKATRAQIEDDAGDGQGPSSWYGGFGVGSFRLKASDPFVNVSANVLGGHLAVGHWLSDYIAVEARVGATGSHTETLLVGAVPVSVDAKADHFFSGLVRLGTARDERVRAYGALGFATLKASARYDVLGVRVGADETKTSISYGAGIEGDISDTLTIGAEYLRYTDGADYAGTNVTVDGITGNLKWKW